VPNYVFLAALDIVASGPDRRSERHSPSMHLLISSSRTFTPTFHPNVQRPLCGRRLRRRFIRQHLVCGSRSGQPSLHRDLDPRREGRNISVQSPWGRHAS